jgi:hypothetical protein
MSHHTQISSLNRVFHVLVRYNFLIFIIRVVLAFGLSLSLGKKRYERYFSCLFLRF